MVIYKTTNKINGKIYVGKDSRIRPSYIGSGMLLRIAIKKYGKENFEKTIIEVCDSLTHLSEREVYWVRELKATDKKIGYNIAMGGTGGDTSSNMEPEDKKRMLENRSASLKKTFSSPEYKRKRSELTKKMWSPEHTEMMRQKMTNREHTWGDKISTARIGWNSDGHYQTSDETKEKLRIASSKNVFVEVSPEMEDTMTKMYQECGPKRMSERLGISAYVIRRVLKKRGIYQKWRKMRPELNIS